MQYVDSRKERIAAQKAYNTALKVKYEATILYNRVDSINRELNSMIELFNKTTLLSAQNAWIQANNPIMGMTPNRQSVKEFEKNTNELIQLLIPDSTDRAQWWNKTEWISQH